MKAPIPILRSFDEAKAKEFYCDFLGFEVVFEHRFGDNFPLYMEVRRGDCVVHLSEHHGDACPGASLRIETPRLEAYIDSLRAKDYRHAKPGKPELQPWGLYEIKIGDPFGNRLIFCEATDPEHRCDEGS